MNKHDFKKLIVNKNNKIKSTWSSEAFLQKKGLYDFILSETSFLDNSYSVKERLLCILNNITEQPKCKICNSNTYFNTDKNSKSIFRVTCSSKCSSQLPKDFSKVNQKAASAKRKQTMLDKYGFEYNTQRPDIKEQVAIKSRKRIPEIAYQKLNDEQWLNEEYNNKKRTAVDIANELSCDYATVIVYAERYGFEIRQTSNYSLYETEIQKFLEEHDIKYISNTKKIITPLELDIFIPEFNLAIEFNGIYWHSNDDKMRHLNKTLACEKQGILLFHIFENEWLNSKDIWKSMILNKCCKSTRVFARKTIFEEVSPKVAKIFLNTNHLQGEINGKHYGLFFNNELIQVITIGKNRFRSGYELLRNCTKQQYVVVGGFKKLLTHLKLNEPLTSYCNRRYSNGHSYEKTGFTFSHYTSPGYFWVDLKQNKLINRFQTQKHKLKQFLNDKEYNPNLSESENMFKNNYRRIWDCGNIVYILNKKREA